MTHPSPPGGIGLDKSLAAAQPVHAPDKPKNEKSDAYHPSPPH